MGQRTIDTVLKLSGESAYKSALKSCTSELKTLKSDLDATTSQFRSNANSMEALTAKGNLLGQMYEQQQKKVALLAGALENAQKRKQDESEQVNALKQQYDDARKALAEYSAEVDKNSEEYKQASLQVDALRDAVIAHQSKLDSASAAVDKYTIQLNRAYVELDRLSDQQEENNQLLGEAKTSFDGCATSIDKYGDKVNQAAESTETAASALEALASEEIADRIGQSVQEVAERLKECSEAAQDYEYSIKQVSTVSDGTVMSQQDLHDGILAFSTDIKRDAKEVAGSVYDALSSGVATAEVLDFTRQSAQLATAGFTDMGTSVDVLTTILNAYKLETAQSESVASKLVKTQDLGKVTVDQLGAVLGRVIPTAAAYGVNLDNVAAAYANMTAAGINAENTTTYLAAMLNELADSGSDVSAILRDHTGKSFAQLMRDGKSLGDVLAILGKSVDNDSEAFSNLWGSSTAASAAVSLFDGSAVAFNTTLTEMQNSSGTVAKNYEIMSKTSVTASQRVEVAANNLKITLGTQLNPVLDKLRNAGAEVMETAASIVKNNPALVSAIVGVVTAMGLLAAALSIGSTIRAVTLAIDALNLSLLANPATAIAVAIAGLGAALVAFQAQTAQTKAEMDALTESAQNLRDTVSSGNQAYDDAAVSTEAAADMVSGYIDRLKKLEAAGVTTQAQQIEYKMILEKINEIMPGINAELDEQTGLVKGGTAALAEQAEQWKKTALAEAAYARYRDDIAAMADAEYEVAKNQALLSMEQKNAAEISDKLFSATEKLTAAREKQQAIEEDTTLTDAQYTAQLRNVKNEIALYETEVSTLNVELAASEERQGQLSDAIKEGEATIRDMTPEVEAATQAYSQFQETAEEGVEKTVPRIGKLATTATDAANEIIGVYNQAKDAARDSIETQIGLFDRVSEKCEMSVADMIENLKSQREAFENYADNIAIAMERGVDFGLVQKLSDGTVESMQILAQLVSATDAEIAALNEEFRGVEDAKDYLTEGMADFSAEWLEYMGKLGANSKEEAYRMGKDTVSGIIDGVNFMKPVYVDAIGDLTEEGNREYRRVNNINSPSKKYRQYAMYDVEGLIEGYRDGTPKFRKAASDLAESGYQEMVRTRSSTLATVSAISTGDVGAPHGESRIYGILNQLLAAVREGKILALDGDTFIGETAGRYDEALGYRKMLADRGLTG